MPRWKSRSFSSTTSAPSFAVCGNQSLTWECSTAAEREPRSRLFVAVEIPCDARRALVDLQRRLGDLNDLMSWEPSEKMHITLQFLGSASTALEPMVAERLATAVTDAPRCALRLASPGAFPSVMRPATVWTAIGGDVQALAELRAAVVAATSSLGFPQEARPFHAHVTIARVRRDTGNAGRRQVGRALADVAGPPPIAFAADRIVLLRSVQGDRTTRFEIVAVCACRV